MKKLPETSISVRALYRELPRIAGAVAKGQRFVVTKYGKLIFTLGPIQTEKGARYTLKDFEALQWTGGPKNLSQQIDDVAYGQ